MKLSNFLLAIIASLTLGLAFGMSAMIVSQEATTVISIPSAEGTSGGGYTVTVPKNMTNKQAQLLANAYEVAKQDGLKYPQLLQGILLRETHAGGLSSYKVAGQEFGLKTNERYYGIYQVKLPTTKDVLAKYPALIKQFNFHTNTDEEIIAKLIENDDFNTAIASKYLKILETQGFNTIQQLAVAYNQGATGARGLDPNTNKYSLGVLAYIQTIYKK
jgi:hypothetical protein